MNDVSTTAAVDHRQLVDEARAATGLTDFGQPQIDEPLEVYVNALNREAKLSAGGIAMRNASLSRMLRSRLQIADWQARHPAYADEVIAAPLVIVGLARSGTTKMQRMMAQDPQLRALPLWELLNPLDDGSPDSETRRIAEAEAFISHVRTAFPAFNAAHPMDACEPDEEVFLMELTLTNNTLMHSSDVPSYGEWLAQQDFAGWYDFLDRMIKTYQHQDRLNGRDADRTWLLKAPFHLGHLPRLFGHWPDATIIHCHRDPRSVIPSMCGLFDASRRMASDAVDRPTIGRVVMRVWKGLIDAYLRDRATLESTHRFVDVAYTEIVRDAIGTIETVYKAAGRRLTDEARQAMLDWEAGNAQHKHGQHKYAPSDYGITEDQIASAFAPYQARFAEYLGA